MPHMAEDIWQKLPYDGGAATVFEAGWPTDTYARNEAQVEEWTAVRALRDVINKALEEARTEKAVGSSLETRLLLHTTDDVLGRALAKLNAPDGDGVDELR
jgi:isoleucyl-tRNA synthetase